jgi:predicted Holliday junction resolvase-like endonuclease
VIEFLALLIVILLLVILLVHYRGKVREVLARADSIAAQKAQQLFEEWKSKELEGLKGQLEAQYNKALAERSEVLKKEYEALFERWKQEHEERIRQDAVQRSIATILGKVGEELAPLLLFRKLGVEPKDIRHIGSPIDYVAFKGLSEGRVDEILFIEVKAGKTKVLTDVERAVRRAVEEKRVSFVVMNVREELERLGQEVTSTS